jgi:DnaK suppressor protein
MYSHINRSREEIAALTPGDEFERLQLASDRDVMLHHVSQESAMLHEMNDALLRLENNTYGICLSCEAPISPNRLSAIPWAANCLHCQEQIERTNDSRSYQLFQQVAA